MQGGRKVKKVILLIFIVLAAFITSLSVYGVDELNTLVVHYYRYDGEYDNYYLHLWNKEPDDKGGIDFAFGTDADQYGVSLSIDLKSTPVDSQLLQRLVLDSLLNKVRMEDNHIVNQEIDLHMLMRLKLKWIDMFILSTHSNW